MSAPNLTQEQAEQRAALLGVESYTIELDLTDGKGAPGENTFRSLTTVRFTSSTVGETTWIDLIADRVHRAVLNGVELDVANYRPEHGITLPNLAAQNELVIEADCNYMSTGDGLTRFVDPADNGVYLHTKFEVPNAKRMFACFDQPDLKAVYQLIVTAPKSWKVIANTPVDSTANLATGATQHTFAITKKFSTYLVALVAGPYAEWRDTYRDQHGEIPLGVYCRASLAEHLDYERIFTQTKQCFGYFHEAFDIPYPFEKYDQCFVPGFSSGAMENVGCVTFNEVYVFRSRTTEYSYERRSETIAHELAHMWFGDLVTMRWWNDLWLNESFATWASFQARTQATEYKHAWSSFIFDRKNFAYNQDRLPTTHPIACDIPNVEAVKVNFDGITYDKGASVLKQLVAYVGQENFFKGLKLYFTKHAWGNTVLADLLNALEQASGRDLSQWSRQWLETSGVNIMRPVFTIDEQGKFTHFAVHQEGAQPGAGEYRTHRIAIGIYDDNDSGELTRVHRIEADIDGESTEIPELVGISRGKLILVNDDDLTYTDIRFDAESLSTLIERVGDISDPVARMLCWSAAWQMVRNTELKARDFVRLILNGIGKETHLGAVQTLLAQAQSALRIYADPTWRDTQGQPEFSRQLLTMALNAKPGSDHQLSFVTALASYFAVLGESELAALAGWLDGSVPLPGLTMDADMRWRLLHVLLAHGKTDETAIKAEEELDQTAKGQEQAFLARVLIPTEESKAQAWQQIMWSTDLPYMSAARAAVLGFAHPAQSALVASYREKYFAEVADMWRSRSDKQAQVAASNLYPGAIEKSTLDATDEWLAAGDHPSALVRLVTEERARIARALDNQAFDGS